ncbi:hypothetical protein PR048_013051 [Dryococelus australis]|uniref:Zinc finger BED domain-containing protein 5 n=1 Tax=Dryococelus australis TaxID=614101 RepID=A0ABQ9HRW3_9NEOP|nr:hypothetical protein PR048_013051 [Dryococelus australis]
MLDESVAGDVKETLISQLAVLIVFVHYVYLQSYQEDLLLCRPLPTNTSGSEIFNILNEFFSSNEIPWEDCAGICTDGAKAMTDHNAGATAKIKAKANNCSSSHCVLHRHALASRKMPSELMICEVIISPSCCTLKLRGYLEEKSRHI